MKNHFYQPIFTILIFVLLLSAVHLDAQFTRLYGANTNESFTKVIQSGTNYYCLGRWLDPANNQSKATITKMNSTGQHISTLALNIASEFTDAVLTPLGDLMVIGYTAPLNSSSQSILGKYGTGGTGSFSFVRSYDVSGRDFFNRIARSPLGGNFPYYIVGAQNDPSNPSTTWDDVILLNVNETGGINWKRKFTSNEDDEFFRDLEILTNGELILAGVSGNRGMIIRLDANGIPINAGTPDNIVFSYTDVSRIGNIGFYAVGETSPNFIPYIIRYDNDFLPQWHFSITGLTDINQIWNNPANGRIYVTGTGVFNGKSRAVLIRLFEVTSSNVIIEWVRFLDNGETSYTSGSYWFLSPNQIGFTDGRVPILNGFSGTDAFLHVNNMDLLSCMTKNVTLGLQTRSHIYNSPEIISTFFDIPRGVNILSSALNWDSHDACKLPCNAAFTFQNITSCGNFQFTNQSTGAAPFTYSWTFGDPSSGTSNGSTSTNPTHQYRLCGTYNVCLIITTNDQCRDTICQTVTFNDNIKPVITCPPNVKVSCNGNTNLTATGTATATDNCMNTAPLLISHTDVISGNISCDGTIGRTWTATDACGNISSCLQLIDIKDNIPPVIVCPPGLTLQCNNNTNPSTTGTASATDDCTSSASINISFTDQQTGNMPCNGIIRRTWSATDACKNTSACVQVIQINDSTRPTIYCPADRLLQCNVLNPPPAGLATATDNCTLTSNIKLSSLDVLAGQAPCNLTITRTWTAEDDCKNKATCVQILKMIDTIPPDISCPRFPTVNTNPGLCYFTGTYPSAVATDSCDSNPTIVCSLITPTSSILITPTTQYPKGVNTITCYARDACGNQSKNCTFQLTVVDKEAPKITCPLSISVLGVINSAGQCKAVVNSIAPTISDNCLMTTVAYTLTGATTGNGVSDASGTVFMSGTTTIQYIVTDMAGNMDSCSFTVNVKCGNTDCIELFEDETIGSAGNWQVVNGTVSVVNTIPKTPPSQVLCGKDNSGGSYMFNSLEYNGNWIQKYGGDCFCFDIRYDNGNVANPATGTSTLNIYSGPSLTSGPRATFVLFNNYAIGNAWERICVPIALSNNGILPGNHFGQWTSTGGPAVFDILIQNVAGIAFVLDFASGDHPSEKVYVDSFCIEKCVDTCVCGYFSNLSARFSQGAPNQPIECGDTTSLDCPSMFVLSGEFHCQGNTCESNTKIDWKLDGPINISGTVNIASGFTLPLTASHFAAPGLYTLTLTGYCDGQPCPPCKLFFEVTACDSSWSCPCENGTSNIELVTNGHFTLGDDGSFTNSYTSFNPGTSTMIGKYSVVHNSEVPLANSQWACIDHTTGTGPFLIVDGASNAGNVAWRQTIPGSDSGSFNLCFYVNNLVKSSLDYDDPFLSVYINNAPVITSTQIPENPDVWIPFNVNWVGKLPATIEIRNATNTVVGNDFAIDDISFTQCENYPNDSCHCAGLDSLTFYQAPFTNNPGYNIPVKCNEKILHILPCIASDDFYHFKGRIKCSDSCNANIIYSIHDSASSTVLTGVGAITNIANGYSEFTLSSGIHLPPGVYTMFLNGNCGKDSCDACIIGFQIPDCDSCLCGSFSNLTVRTGGAPNQSIQCGKTYTLNCPTVFQIGGEFACQGNDCDSTSKVDWNINGPIGGGGTVLANTGFTLPLNAQSFGINGLYTLTLTGYCDGKPCPPCIIHFEVTGCSPCCKDSIAFSNALANFQTNGALGNCNLFENGTGLDSCMQVTWSWGDGNTTGPVGNATQVSHVYTGTGTYNVCYTIEEIDANGKVCHRYKKCDSIYVICDTCECAGVDHLSFGGHDFIEYATCNSEKIVDLPCAANGQPFYFHGNIHCTGDSCLEEKFEWVIKDPVGNTTTSGFGPVHMMNVNTSHFDINNLNAALFTPGVNYTLTVTWYCGGKKCTCDIKFRFKDCDCKCGEFTNVFLRPTHGAPSISVKCDGDAKQVVCPSPGQPFNISGQFHCVGNECPTNTQIDWMLLDPSGNKVDSGTFISTPNWSLNLNNHHFGKAGTYTLMLTGHCGSKLCPCKIKFTFKEACPCADCICGKYSKLSIKPGNSSPKSVACGDTATINCPGNGLNITFSGQMVCEGDSCPKTTTLDWILINSIGNNVASGNGVIVNPNFTLPVSSSLMTSSGLYTLQLIGNCGSQRCTCEVKIKMEKPCPDKCDCDGFTILSAISRGPILPRNCGDTIYVPDALKLFFSAQVNCKGICPPSPSIIMTLTDPNGILVPVTSIDENSFPVPGTYILNMIGYCGNKVCKCTITFIKENNCCKDQEIFEQHLLSAITVNTKPGNCKVTVQIGSLPACDYIEKINWGDGTSSVGPFVSGNMPMHSYTANGTYSISIIAVEEDPNMGMYCFVKLIKQTVNIKCGVCPHDTSAFSNIVKNYQPNITIDKCDLRITNLSSSANIKITWIWGDGTDPCPPLCRPGQDSLRHRYSKTGKYNLCYKIQSIDESGNACLESLVCQEINIACDPGEGFKNENDQKIIRTKSSTNGVAVRVYPNPNTGSFIVDLITPALPGTKLKVVGLTGQVLAEKIADLHKSTQTMNVQTLPSGLYFIQILVEGKLIKVEKFIKR